MGSDAEVFIFDYEAYTREVVPAFYEILLTRQIPEWLHPALKARRINPANLLRVDLLQHCTYLAEDLAWDGPYEDRHFYETPWQQRVCKSEDCPERNHCPFHQGGGEELNYELLGLFEAAVSIKCLGESQFVGRSQTPIEYSDFLCKQGLTKGPPLLKLLGFLGKRGFLFGHVWSSGCEGINGWLDPQETIELLWYLEHLPLPKYEASFEAMREFRRPDPLLGKFGITGYECDGFSFEELSLSFIRTVAEIASTASKGILWGNSLMPADYYRHQENDLPN